MRYLPARRSLWSPVTTLNWKNGTGGKQESGKAVPSDGAAVAFPRNHTGCHHSLRILGSAFAAENFSGRFVSVLVDAGVQIPEKTLDAIAVVLITLLLSYITLIFGELVPKRLAMHNSEKIALGVSGLVTTASKIFAPLVGLLTVSTNGILRLFGIDPNEDDDQVTEEEIRMMVDAGSEKVPSTTKKKI